MSPGCLHRSNKSVRMFQSVTTPSWRLAELSQILAPNAAVNWELKLQLPQENSLRSPATWSGNPSPTARRSSRLYSNVSLPSMSM